MNIKKIAILTALLIIPISVSAQKAPPELDPPQVIDPPQIIGPPIITLPPVKDPSPIDNPSPIKDPSPIVTLPPVFDPSPVIEPVEPPPVVTPEPIVRPSPLEDFTLDGIIHENMHEKSRAQVMYDNWKADKSANLDPFKRIAEGYKSEKDVAKSNYVGSIYQPSVNSFVETSIEDRSSDIEERKLFRDEQITQMYKLSVNENNKVDTQNFHDEYQTYIDEKSTRAGLYYELRQAQFAAMGVDTGINNQSQNDFSSERSHNATSNLLNFISNDIKSQKDTLKAAFQDNIALVEQSVAYGADARGLASSFSGDCPACDLPEFVADPVALPVEEPTPIPDPVYTPPLDPCGINYDRARYASWRYYQCP